MNKTHLLTRRIPNWTKTNQQDFVINIKIMRGILNIIIVVLIVGWLLGFIGFGAVVGNLIHILLILAVVAIVMRLLAKT